ncbi:MAG TPA: VOC family protein [Ktedonobacteraceae bacterium]|nr:VOC family protein [Ktedonobacteraceae bacterium]HZU66965.1 VOC family protein [Ktedonobacteraceae bacterium]
MLARLDHFQLLSEAPERLVAFYQDIMGMTTEAIDHDLWLCQGPQRRLLVGRGRSNTLGFGAYRCETRDDLSALRTRLLRQEVQLEPSPSPLFSTDAFSFSDPDGNRLVFGLPGQQPDHRSSEPALTGRLQHLVLASENAEPLVRFYSDIVGLAISDKMLDGTAVAACWMRADEDREHHSFAIFRTAKKGIDHHSYEVGDWMLIRDWADYLASKGVKLVWGPGRHGPGNNLFIFVLDPDGNRIELSAELELVEPGRPAGIWPKEPDTLNRWGEAFMRS